MTTYDGVDGWITWYDGECPVDGHDVVTVRYADESTQTCRASSFGWEVCESNPPSWRITAYRVEPTCATEPDMVNSPPHYQLLPGVEVYDVRAAMLAKIPADVPHDQVSDWDRATEYLMRMWNKNGIEDAKKAQWYLTKLLEKMS